MKILITGAKGFVGKNLVSELRNQGFTELLEYDIDTNPEKLDIYAKDCAFVFHLAGVNRTKEQTEFMDGNFGFASLLLSTLKKHNNNAPILMTSSIQAELDNAYGRSKKAGEDLIFNYGKTNNIPVFVYRLPNVFGKWCKPNYNSAVATFCHNIANDLEIQINDPNVLMKLVYVDDVVASFSEKLKNGSKNQNLFESITPIHSITLGKIVDLLNSFKQSRESLQIPNMSDAFTKKLYSTYLSYLPEDKFSYLLKMNIDNRGSFTEFIKTAERGQVSVNISKPNILKGNHWHHTKNEKFLVISGVGVIRLRKISTDKITEYHVSSDKLEVVDIPVGYTHHIENLGKTDMVTIMWVNELFDKEKPDTYYLEV